MEVTNCLKKFKVLLDQIKKSKIILSDINIERLITSFEDIPENSTAQHLLHIPAFSDIIFDNIKEYPKKELPIKVFHMKLMTLLFKNKLPFSKIQLQGFQEILAQNLVLKTVHTTLPSITLHLASIKAITALISNYSELNILIEQKIWMYVLIPNIHQSHLKLANAAYEFISKLVWTLNDCNKKQELVEVLRFVVNPIKTSDYLDLREIDLKLDEICKEKIYSHLKTLSIILSETDNMLIENNVVPLLKRSSLVKYLYKILSITRCLPVIQLIHDSLWRIIISLSQSDLSSGKIDEFCDTTIANHYNFVTNLFLKRSFSFIIDYVVQLNVNWSHFEDSLRKKSPNIKFPLTFERNGRKLLLRNQFIVHLIRMLMAYPLKEKTITNIEINELTVILGKIITEQIYCSCYLLKYLSEGCDVKQVTIHAVRELFRLKGHMATAQADIVFLGLYHILGMFILSDGADGLILGENPLKTPDDVKLLSNLLNAIQMLLKEHNIKWYNRVEIANLQARLMNLLKQNILLQTRLLVQVLDLIDLCVKKFLSPNMTLLVETKHDSTVSEIGAVMKMYIQHDDWEVRDSALNLLLSCIDIAFVKYIPMRSVINENNLMIHETRIAMNDPEFYPRSTALNCLAIATKVENLWREVIIHTAQIYLQLFYIVRNNSEGMVRKQAVNVLRQIYMTQNISQTLKNILYELIFTTALNDLHWEVQLAALEFWDDVIQIHLTYRGMIDGEFPAVTFSKEKRKIVSLNEKEIGRILACIMNDLSSIGCFTVLLECMNEDNNIEVMERAYSLARKIVSILDHYKFQTVSENTLTYSEQYVEVKKTEDIVTDSSCEINSENFEDEILDILDTEQSELLINLHDRLSDTGASEMQQMPIIPRKENVNSNKFLETFKSMEYISIINAKKNWKAEIVSLDELLNEVLNL